jgi:hypothetical protein
MGVQRSLSGGVSEVLWSWSRGWVGHDGGFDPKAKTAVLTRCLSPLGTGNDETGFVGTSGDSADCSTDPLVSHCVPPLWKSVVVRSSTANAVEINIASQKTSEPAFRNQ